MSTAIPPLRRCTVLVSAGTLAALAVSPFLVSQVDAASRVAATALTVTGVLLTGVVTALGLLLKYSVDVVGARLQEAAEKRLQLDSEHRRELSRQAEDRLRLDTAIRAVALMSTGSGAPADATQKAGALFALASLGQLDFALALLGRLWPQREVDNLTALWLLDRALTSERAHQDTAVELMRENVARLTHSGSEFDWPASIGIRWPAHLSMYARELLLDVTARVVLAIPCLDWSIGHLRGVVALLHSALTTDAHVRIRGNSALLLHELLATPVFGRILFLPTGNVEIRAMRRTVDEVLAQIRADHPVEGFSDGMIRLVEEVKRWRAAVPLSATTAEVLRGLTIVGFESGAA
jgi:hypothetical protein